MNEKKKAIRHSFSDRIFYAVNYSVMTVIMIIVLYPIIFSVSASISDPYAVTSGQVWLWPVDITFRGYKEIFRYDAVMQGFFNTIFYTVLGTGINLVITIMGAYALARKTLPGRGLLTLMFSFTMLFSGGMIPSYILVRDLKMIDTIWAIVIPGALSVYNMVIMRTFFQSNVPEELLEASQLDGCSDIRYLISVVLPLSHAVMAVISLYYAVGHWNAYFKAFLYLNDQNLYPLQIVLRNILLANTVDASTIMDEELAAAQQGMADLLKFSLMVFSSLPMILVYPFVRKFFAKGVLLGSLKG